MKKKDVIIGIILGVLVLAGIAGLGYFIYRRIKGKRRKRGFADQEDTDESNGCGVRLVQLFT